MSQFYQNPDLLLENYDFDLPQELIAERPVSPRHNSKLLIYDENDDSITHDTFLNLANYLPGDSSLVVNQSKVFPCRLKAKKLSGGKVEVFILDLSPYNNSYPCLLKSSGKKNIGDQYIFNNNSIATIIDKDKENQGVFFLKFNLSLDTLIDECGLIPIPPYIRKGDSDAKDLRDYQTIFAKDQGSVAAPTAGLHFTDEVFNLLKNKQIKTQKVTLHVGQGTFAPVKSDNIEDHKMHSERFYVEEKQWSKISNSVKRFCVGTTSLRVLESLWTKKDNIDFEKTYKTNIFLYPGKSIHSIDGLITNFHLPKSTLLMLVSCLVGREKTLELYNIAVENRYRFFSYGDAMLIKRKDRQND